MVQHTQTIRRQFAINNPLLLKSTLKYRVCCQVFLGRSMASTKPMHIYMGFDFLLLHFQKPAT